MGIEGFVKILANTSPGCISVESPTKKDIYPDAVWMDLNSTLHMAHSLARNHFFSKGSVSQADFLDVLEKKFKERMSFNIDPYVDNLKLLGLMVDGIPPFAKTHEQRKRRYIAAKEIREGETREVGVEIPYNLRSIAITPGTDLMFKIDKMIIRWIGEFETRSKLEVIYSPHTERGEGEHKIKDEIRKSIRTLGRNSNHVIIANDNDMVLLSIVSGVNNIVIQKNTTQHRKDITYIYIEELKKENKILMRNNIMDYVLITSLFGNDFVPAQPLMSHKSYSEIMEKYIEMLDSGNSRPLVREHNGKISVNWEALLTIADEHNWSDTYGSIAAKDDLRSLAENDPNLSKYKGLWYSRALMPRSGETNTSDWINKTRLNKMVKDYTDGLIWTLLYYFLGIDSVSDSWIYPFEYAPFLSEVSSHRSRDESDGAYSKGLSTTSILENMLYVFPPEPKTNKIMPKELSYWTEPDSPVSDMFPSDFVIDKYIKNRDLAILPPMERDRIKTCMKVTIGNSEILDSLTKPVASQKRQRRGNKVISASFVTPSSGQRIGRKDVLSYTLTGHHFILLNSYFARKVDLESSEFEVYKEQYNTFRSGNMTNEDLNLSLERERRNMRGTALNQFGQNIRGKQTVPTGNTRYSVKVTFGLPPPIKSSRK